MKVSGRLKLVSELRDLQIEDSNGINCGIVDDIEFEGTAGGPLGVKALIVGPGGYTKRLPGWWMAIVRLIAGDGVVRIPWSEVESVESMVRLKKPAAKLGLNRAEGRALKLLPPIGCL